MKNNHKKFRLILPLMAFVLFTLSGCINFSFDYGPSYSSIQKMETKCEAGDLYTCTKLGNIHAWGDWEDIDASKHYYSIACKENYMEACYQLGTKYTLALIYKKSTNLWPEDPEVGIPLIAKACAGNHAQACVTLATYYRIGRGVEKDLQQALFLYEKSCEMNPQHGSAVACGRLGDIYSKGEETEQNLARASQKYREGCNIGGQPNCVSFAELNRLDANETVSASLTRLYNSFCEAPDGEACNTLGRIFERGYGVPKDSKIAAASYKKSCDEEFYKGCFNLGRVYSEKRENPTQMAELFRKSCDGGFARGCYHLAGAYYSGTGVPKDKAQVNLLNQRACDLEAHFCRSLGLQSHE
jgi:uncharacterized protein